jgi:hypothetical protein
MTTAPGATTPGATTPGTTSPGTTTPGAATRAAGRFAPRRQALLVHAAATATVAVGALVSRALLPQASSLVRSLVVSLPLVVLAPVLATRLGGWRSAGVNRPREWHDLHLLVLPALLTLVPLLGGLRQVDRATLAVLVTGYVLTGFFEETIWRGVVLRALAPTGPLRAALFGSVLFGAAHLTNVLLRENAALVAAQAVGAFCFGFGYAALRLRTGTIVPLMVLHMLTDLLAAVGGLPKIPVLVGQDVVLLVLGLVLLRHHRGGARTPEVGVA